MKTIVSLILLSSANRERTSLFIKGFVVFAAGIIYQQYGIDFTSDVQLIVDHIMNFIIAAGLMVSAIGGVRKIVRTARGENDVLK